MKKLKTYTYENVFPYLVAIKLSIFSRLVLNSSFVFPGLHEENAFFKGAEKTDKSHYLTSSNLRLHRKFYYSKCIK